MRIRTKNVTLNYNDMQTIKNSKCSFSPHLTLLYAND